MLPAFLQPETEVRESGLGNSFDLGEKCPESLLITLGITHILEQQSMDVAILGSQDGAAWPPKPLIAFSQKFYCGTYQVLLTFEKEKPVRYLRARWTVNRWGRGDLRPLFGFYIFVQQPGVRAMAGSAA
jgi:hypothetical protein